MWHMVINSNQHVRVAWSCTYVKPVNFEGFKRFKSVLLLTSSQHGGGRGWMERFVESQPLREESSDRRLQRNVLSRSTPTAADSGAKSWN